jgi:hypothetical protein
VISIHPERFAITPLSKKSRSTSRRISKAVEPPAPKAKRWVTFAKRVVAGAEKVLDYLSHNAAAPSAFVV